jgi:hypothetical protein
VLCSRSSVSSDHDLERLLREGWKNVPEPDSAVTRRARERAISAARPRPRRRTRTAALVGTTLAVAIGLGIGFGSLVAPSGTASEGPVGLGFVPQPGWFALQAPSRSPADQPAVVMASNVQFAPDDIVNGLAEPSALPYSTLLTLPPRGVVIVASFIAAEGQPWTSTPYPRRKTPLRLAEATPYIELGTAIRPDQPLGQYQLRAAIGGWNVDVNVYFGTPRPSARLLRNAQRQLSGLVARPAPSAAERAHTTRPARVTKASGPVILDRTFSCSPGFLGGVYSVETRVHAGTGRSSSGWERPSFAAIGTSAAGAAQTAVENYIAWISAGTPSRGASVVAPWGSYSFPFRTWGTVAVNRDLCRASSARAPFGTQGLRNRSVGAFEEPLDCTTPRRVLVRVRATLTNGGALKSYRSFLRTPEPARAAEVVVRTTSGKPVAYARVLDNGKATLFTAPGCVDD